MNTKITFFNDSEYDIRSIRDKVFGFEQGIPRDLDWDGKDFECHHVIAYSNDGLPVGTGRLQPDGKIGRLAVLSEYRDLGIGRLMLDALIQAARDDGIKSVQLHAQAHATSFYKNSGFVIKGAEFIEAGINHVKMVRNT